MTRPQVKIKTEIDLSGIDGWTKDLPKTMNVNLETFSKQVMATAKRLIGKPRTPKKKTYYGPQGGKYEITEYKRPKNKKTIVTWRAGSWIPKTMAVEHDKRGYRYRIGPKAGWEPQINLEHGGKEKKYYRELYTQKPTRRKRRKAGQNAFSVKGTKVKVYADRRSAKFLGKHPASEMVSIKKFGLMQSALKVKQSHLIRQTKKAMERSLQKNRVV